MAVSAVAHADEPQKTDDEDGAFVPFPKRSIGFGLMIHGTGIGSDRESGVGPVAEFAIGRDRWQYLAEFAISTSTRQEANADPSYDMGIAGKVLHGGAGVRWLARQFRPDQGAGVELFLLSMLGVQRFTFDDGRLTRPELAAGFGMQVRTYRRPRLAFRLDARVLFIPNSNDSSLVQCRGRCTMDGGSSTGFMTAFGFAW
jgi:hypothetical protein